MSRPLLFGALLLAALSACGAPESQSPSQPSRSGSTALPATPAAPAAPPSPAAIAFTDVAAASGVTFLHRNGASGQKYMPETLGSGVCVLDFDADGWPDLYFVQSGPLPTDPGSAGRVGSVLYRNRGDGTFEDVTARAGVGGSGYGMGCTVADIDGDGDEDLFVTGFEDSLLYRNNGNGTFTDIAAPAGVKNRRWGSSAAFGDYDRDGRPDLYVVNYVDFTLTNNIYCGDSKPGYRTYCHPQNYNGVPDVLYHNLGGGKFRDVSREAGVADPSGKGLGVVWGDFDQDGWEDIFVANDSTPNFLYHNNGNGSFTEMGQKAGVALGEEGVPHAGMGIAVGDCDDDGREDLFVTNLSQENNELYRNLGAGIFADNSFVSGLGAPSLLYLGFGTCFVDADGDGDEDLIVANGHILDNVELYSDTITFEQAPQFFENLGPCRFREISAEVGAYFRGRDVGRGVAVVDWDHDLDPDLVISSNARPAHLLRNDSPRSGRHVLALGLVGKAGGDALGAKVEVRLGTRSLWKEVRSASSYLSQSDLTLHFGLGSASRAEAVVVRWPDGRSDEIGPLEADRYYRLEEGKPPGEGVGPGKSWRR